MNANTWHLFRTEWPTGAARDIMAIVMDPETETPTPTIRAAHYENPRGGFPATVRFLCDGGSSYGATPINNEWFIAWREMAPETIPGDLMTEKPTGTTTPGGWLVELME